MDSWARYNTAAWVLALAVQAQEDVSISGWGQAIAYIPSPPAIILNGGKADTSNAYSYTSAPNSPQAILLPLTSGFSASTPPLTILDSPNAPAYAWHTLTPFSNETDKWDLLAFGGDAGPSEPTQTQSDSAWYMSVNIGEGTAEWQRQASGWGNQPSRRIYHSAVGGGGKVYITGGLRNDGSGIGFGETYEFDPSHGFVEMAPLPRAVYHHGSVLLPNGTIIVLGGVSIDMATGVPAAQTMARISILDSSSPSSTWIEKPTVGIAPSARRGMAIVLSSDGKEIYIQGGASTTFDTIFADSWSLNVETLEWKQVGITPGSRRVVRQSIPDPGARYDHSAVLGPDGQVVILGGYGGDGVADPGPFVFDLPEGTWSDQYAPPAQAVASAGPSRSMDPSQSASVSTSEASSATPVSQSGSATAPLDQVPSGQSKSESSSAVSSTISSSAFASDSSSTTSPMPLAAQLGLIFGILGAAALVVAGLVWRYRRRKRRERLIKAIYGANSGGGSDRSYGSREKGGEGLMEEAREAEYNEYKNVPPGPPSPEKAIGLGMGTIKASFASLRNFRRAMPSETYAVLDEDGPSPNVASPVRQPTRRSGTGIRLVGPRAQRGSYVPVTSPTSLATGDSRRDMLRDEDSRNFPPGASDWEVGDDSVGRWKSARSILADQQEDPFEDDDESLRAPIRGGPVPTPLTSTTNLDPFNERDIGDGEYGLPHVHSDPLLDLNGLLPPTSHKRYSAMSGVSGPSSAISDTEEGVVQYANIGSPGSSSVFSPVESAYMPIKRTDTFFKRMAAGGITSLLSNKNIARSGSVQTTVLNIRDPAPPPSLWPVVSRDMLMPRSDRVDSGLQSQFQQPDSTSAKPPTAWKGENLKLDLDRPTHEYRPSLTSINSARSMRDMVIIQREPTDSSAESAIIEMTSPDPMGGPFDDIHQSREVDTPESVVFDGADFAMSPVSMDDHPHTASAQQSKNDTFGKDRFASSSTAAPVPSTPPRLRTLGNLLATPSSTHSPSGSSQSHGRAIPPSGSPIPHPVLSHRRPVSEMVNSINKRGGGGDTTPTSLFSPASRYSSPASTPRQGRVRPTTLYEAVKRDRLHVANPDSRR